MSWDELNSAVERSGSGGGTWVNLRSKGDRLEGTLVAFEIRPMMYQGEPVLTRKTQQPRYEYVLTLQTGESDGAADDGIRKVGLDERGQDELKRAIREAGVNAEEGGLIVLGIVADRADGEMKHTHLRARYTPPAKTINVPGLEDF